MLKPMKIKIKQRLKKALFAFFKDEILETVGYNHTNHGIQLPHLSQHQVMHSELNFTEIKSEFFFSDSYDNNNNIPFDIFYEQALEKAKIKLFNEVIKFVKIDNNSVIDTRILPNNRRIQLRLFVGNIK